MLDEELMQHYGKAFCSGMSEDQLKDPAVSPVYTDLYALRGKLPPALFTVGTEDCLLDDTMLMALKWQMAGAETILKVLPGSYPSIPTSSSVVAYSFIQKSSDISCSPWNH